MDRLAVEFRQVMGQQQAAEGIMGVGAVAGPAHEHDAGRADGLAWAQPQMGQLHAGLQADAYRPSRG